MSVDSTNGLGDLLTPSEAAALLPSTSAQTVIRWAKEGLIPFVELPGGRRSRRFFRRSDIEELLTPRMSSADTPRSASSADEGDSAASAVSESRSAADVIDGQAVLPL